MQNDAGKSIVILKAAAESLGPVELFLKNRGWALHSTTQLKQALLMVVQHQPKFILICIDHSHPKAAKLPKVLKTAFPACVMAYSEKGSASAFNLLNQCGTEYLLYSPVTGPAIERLVNRYYKDQQNRENAGLSGGQAQNSGVNSGEGTISIRGSSSYGSSDIQNILAMMGEDSMSAVQTGASLNLGTAQEAGVTGDLLSSRQKGTPGKLMQTRRSPEEIAADPRSTKNDSLLVRGTTRTLEGSCQVTEKTPVVGVGTTKNVACLVINSTRYSGYLLTVMRKETHIDEKFIRLIQDRLLNFLKEHDDFNETPSLELTIREVPFEDWALEHADFLRKSVHEGKDVAIAFFPHKNTKIPVRHLPDQPMAAVSIEHLHGDEPVEFNLYLHLPRNNKYVLYTPRGSVFYELQKTRLNDQGVAELHILQSDLVDLPKYKAQANLNETIKEFFEVDPDESES